MTAHPIPTAALDDRLGFVGTAGSGKTYNAMGAEERVLDRKGRVVHVDPLGVSWGLRLMADGKTPSPYRMAIFGGPHGDLPLTPLAGSLIGETVAGMSDSCIIDLSQLGTKAAERRFMLAFLEALYRKTSGEPFHLIFDEADLWAPERILDKEGDAMKLAGMMETIVRRGRVKGFIPWLITQRPAVISKNVLSQVDGLVAFKLTASQDRKALGAWIEGQADVDEGKRILAQLPTMARGQGVIWVPGRGILETVQFPEKKTFDSSRTPKRGEKVKRTELKPLDLDTLKEKLASVEQEVKANDPKALRAEISRLKAELQKAPKGIIEKVTDKQEITAADHRGYVRGKIEGYGEAIRSISGIYGSLTKSIGHLKSAIENTDRSTASIQTWIETSEERKSELKSSGSPAPSPYRAPTPYNRALAPPRAAKPSLVERGDGNLSKPHRKIVDAVAWWNASGFDAPTRVQVAFVAGYKPGTGSFNTYLGALSTLGLISYPDRGFVSLTDAGRAASTTFVAPDTAELHGRVYAMLTSPQTKILEVLINAYPDPMSRDDVAVGSDYQPGTGSFNTYIGSLSSIDLITYPQRGMARAADWLFSVQRRAA